MIEIHQFSTGIQYEKTTRGGWVSLGFTGQYLNRTLDPIPQPIEKAISNKEFAISEGTVTEKPALIGREVTENDQQWSVLAVIIQGTDEVGRHFPAYRYFYTEGKENLEKLVRWWIAENHPVFNPFEQVESKYYQPEPEIEIPLDNFQNLLTDSIPLIIPQQRQCSPLIVNRIAQKIAGTTDVAWAYNVGGLDYPKSFQTIYPNSPEASELISQVLRSKPASSGVIKGEHSLKLAIQNLINKEEVNVQYLQTLEKAFTDEPQINDKLWKSYFDGKGANQAISQEMYNSDMVRLLTLQAIILPQTLPEFLEWLEKRSKEKEHYQTSLNFQQEIVNKIGKKAPKIAEQVSEGVKIIIAHLLNKPELLQATIWLLGSTESIWANLYVFDVKKEINHDLSLMIDFAKGKKDLTFNLVPQWQPIWNQIRGFWRSDNLEPLPQYIPLARLFDHLADYKYSAVFYHISKGSVPKSVFKRVTNNSYNCSIYKLKIEKHVSKLELLGLTLIKLGGRIMPIYFVLPLATLLFLIGGLTGFFLGQKTEIDQVNSSTKQNTESKKLTLIGAGLKINKAEGNITTTYRSLKEFNQNKLVTILNKTLKDNENKYPDLKDIQLNRSDLDKPNFNNNKDIQQNWIKAIFLYQKDNKLLADGSIDKNGETFSKLKSSIQ